jgi:hypothetical protein
MEKKETTVSSLKPLPYYKDNTLNHEFKKSRADKLRQVSFDLGENIVIELCEVERFHLR